MISSLEKFFIHEKQVKIVLAIEVESSSLMAL